MTLNSSSSNNIMNIKRKYKPRPQNIRKTLDNRLREERKINQNGMTILKLIYCKILISKIPRRMDNLRRLTLNMETLAINLQVMINFRRSNLHIVPLRCKMIMLHTIKFRLISHQEGVKAIISNNTQFRTIAVSNTILFQEKLKIRSCITRII